MKFDTAVWSADLSTIAERAREMESLGYDCAWSVETTSDPFLPLAFAAAATSKLEIGTNIAVAFARSPFSMAQIAWDLQRMSQGRLHLGLGTQVRAHVERRFSMPFDHPAARVTDYIRCMRAIWDTFQNGTRPDYQGRFYQFKLINPFFNPGPIEHPQIPVYLAGVNERMCRAAGEVADGFAVHPMHSAGYLRDIVKPALAAGAQAGGRNADDIVLYAPVFVVSGDSEATRAKTEAAVRQQVAFYASTPSYRILLEYHGFGSIAKALSAAMRQGDTDEMMRLVPDELLDAVAVYAPREQLAAALRQRYEGLLDRLSLYRPLDPPLAGQAHQQFVASVKAG
ncbi:MAG: TIGR03617 family F420-dependent LLM class oxidoreductase [Gammaproteobacteria bacterium]|nr:TIGR03617 family F420-dependent LLM class oxidoreductase [Gammaproteobacteria bacterium]